MSFEIKAVAVIGAGAMGYGVAQVLATYGHQVKLVDVSSEILDKAGGRIRWSLGRLAERGKVNEAVEAIVGRIEATVDLHDAVRNADLVIEAIPERIDAKMGLFGELDSLTPKHCILCSNTSGLPITLMAETTRRPERVLGMHWFNPPPLMRLVEVIKSKYTSNEVATMVSDLAKKVGKDPITVGRDIRDFVANRVYRAMRYEAFLMVLRGDARIVEVDSACRYKIGLPMGPFELVDFGGAIETETLANMAIEDVYRKCPEWEPQQGFLMFRGAALELVKQYYDRGLLGVKSGEGFYRYPEPGKWVKAEIPEDAGKGFDPFQVLAPAINASAWLIRNNVASVEDIDRSMKLGLNFPAGLLEMADKEGIQSIINILETKRDRVRESYGVFYRPDPLLMELVQQGKSGRESGEGFHKY